MPPANESRRYFVKSSLIGWAHTHNVLCDLITFGLDNFCAISQLLVLIHDLFELSQQTNRFPLLSGLL